MPRKRNRRKEANDDWEASGTDASYTNGSSSNGISNPVDYEEVGEPGGRNGNDYTNNQNGGGRFSQGKEGSSLQHKHKATLGQWAQAVGETSQTLGDAQRTINSLQRILASHLDDIGRIDETSTRLIQLEEDCKRKDKVLERQEKTITTLRSMDEKAKTHLKNEAAQVEKEKKELEQEKVKLEKRVTAATAEERHKLKREFEECKKQQDESHEKRKQELENESVQKRDECNRRAAALEAEKERLLTLAKERQKEIEAQAVELEKIEERYDVLERAKDSLRNEKLAREKELELIKKEFALDTKPMEYLYVF